MRKIIFISLILLLIIPASGAQEDCEAITVAREVDALYNSFLATRGEIDATQMMAAAETFHGSMGDILLRCGSTAVSISNDIAGEFSGFGTEQDPYAFGQAGAASNGITIRPIEFIRNAEEILGEDVTVDEEWVLVTVEIGCPADSLNECEANAQNFRLIADSGIVYDSEFVLGYDDLLDVKMPPGRLRTGSLPFHIASTETSFNVLYYPEGLFGGDEQEITYYRTENFVRISATTEVIVRTGPGVRFPPRSSLRQYQEAIAIGRNDNGAWLQIEEGWVFAELVNVEVGNLMWLPVIEPE
ncbi:MAG: hypothetical protein Q9P44_14025 [Anaerolineae bacterium]|nr:hypothetical protein [Anaerolineae bacterium]